jgi:hypothetical protein
MDTSDLNATYVHQLESWIEAGTKSPQFSLGQSSITKLSMQSSRSGLRLTSAKSPTSPSSAIWPGENFPDSGSTDFLKNTNF